MIKYLQDYKNSYIFVGVGCQATGSDYKEYNIMDLKSLTLSCFYYLKMVAMYLTKAEEQIMQILWDMEKGIVRDIRLSFSDPKPARNTVSTVVRVLEKKGFVGHTAYGNTHLYHPLVSKEEYSKSQLFRLLDRYFDNSFPALASFFAREKDLSMNELEELLEDVKKELKKSKKKK